MTDQIREHITDIRELAEEMALTAEGVPGMNLTLSKARIASVCRALLAALDAQRPEVAPHAEWLEDELMEVMRIVAPGMGGPMPDEIKYAIMVTAIRRLMEADTDKYEALLERWQKRNKPQGKA